MKKRVVLACLIFCICVFISGCGNKTRTAEEFIKDFDALLQEHREELSMEEEVSIEDKKIEISYDEDYEAYVVKYNGNTGGTFKVYNSDGEVLSQEERKSLPLNQTYIMGACKYDSTKWIC